MLRSRGHDLRCHRAIVERDGRLLRIPKRRIDRRLSGPIFEKLGLELRLDVSSPPAHDVLPKAYESELGGLPDLARALKSLIRTTRQRLIQKDGHVFGQISHEVPNVRWIAHHRHLTKLRRIVEKLLARMPASEHLE